MGFLEKKNNNYDPFSVFEGLQHEINDLFNESFSLLPTRGMKLGQKTWKPAVDVVNKKDKYLITADIPGIDKENINISIDDDVLSIQGTQEREVKEEKDDYLHVERTSGSFQRSFRLPNDIDSEKVKANYKNGTLKLEIPKSKESRQKQISIDVD